MTNDENGSANCQSREEELEENWREICQIMASNLNKGCK